MIHDVIIYSKHLRNFDVKVQEAYTFSQFPQCLKGRKNPFYKENNPTYMALNVYWKLAEEAFIIYTRKSWESFIVK